MFDHLHNDCANTVSLFWLVWRLLWSRFHQLFLFKRSNSVVVLAMYSDFFCLFSIAAWESHPYWLFECILWCVRALALFLLVCLSRGVLDFAYFTTWTIMQTLATVWLAVCSTPFASILKMTVFPFHQSYFRTCCLRHLRLGLCPACRVLLCCNGRVLSFPVPFSSGVYISLVIAFILYNFATVIQLRCNTRSGRLIFKLDSLAFDNNAVWWYKLMKVRAL